MSLSLPPPPPEPTPRRTGDWGLLAGSPTPEPDRTSAELSKRTVAWLLAVLLAIGVGLLTVQIVAPTGSATWLLLLGVGVVGFLFLWRNLQWGIIGYLCVAWMVLGTPDVAQGGSGGGQKLLVSQLGLVALLAVWGLRKLFSYDLTLFKSPVNAPIICYLAFAAWSTVNSLLFPNADVLKHSPETFLPVNILEYALRFLALAGVLLLGNTLTGKHLRFAAIALLVPGIATFTGLLKFVPVTDYQAFAQILAMAICAAFALLDTGAVWRRLLAGGVALAIFGVYFIRDAEWVSGWMGALVALALITWRVNRKIVYGAAALIAVLVVANFPYFWEKVYTSNFYGGRVKRGKRAQDEQGNLSNDRSRMLYASTIYAAKFPLGIGLGNYRAYNLWFGRPEN
ncbi:MAG: hypothetical protein H7Y38_03155, partial [Armatimonadetes bacterium]|nr:hypothetical protein [Armatimonadota bacterium]